MKSHTAQMTQEPFSPVRPAFKFPDKGKEELGTWPVFFAASDLIGKFICPPGTPLSDASEIAGEMTVIGNPGPGRLILRYDFGRHGVIYAKVYPNDLATHGYGALKALWDAGFNEVSRYRVPEPLLFVPEHRLVLQRSVDGDALASAMYGNTEIDLIEGSREAARWLATLHRSTVRIGEPESLWDSFQIFRLFRKFIEAAAAHPTEQNTLLEALQLLQDQFQQLPSGRPVVLCHGRFRHEHIFLSPGIVSVIDLDQCRPADPARDAAEFVHALRWEAFKIGFDLGLAAEASKAFLEEYLTLMPQAAPAVLPCWSAFTLVTLLRYFRRTHTPERHRYQAFLREEMQRIREFRV